MYTDNWHIDRLGSVRLITDEDGDVLKRYNYTAFGSILSDSGSFDNAYRYTSQSIDGNDIYYYHLDPLGSPLVITKAGLLGAELVKQYKYKAFGDLKYESGTYQDNHKFTGKELDGTGLYYFGARYYDKGLGRWIVQEPKSSPSDLNLNDPQTLNPYVYCWNNPLRYVDPNGGRILEKETNKPLTEQEMYEQSLMILGESLGKPGLTLSFYYKFSVWGYIFSPIKQGPQLDFGPIIESSKGIKYHFLSVNVGASNIPMIKASLENPIGKTKGGEDLLRISTGSGYKMWTIQLTGTKESLNNYLRNKGYKIVVNKNMSTEKHKSYELKLIREKRGEE